MAGRKKRTARQRSEQARRAANIRWERVRAERTAEAEKAQRRSEAARFAARVRWARERAAREEQERRARERSERARRAAETRWRRARERGEARPVPARRRRERARDRAIRRALDGLPPLRHKLRTKTPPPDYHAGLAKLIRRSLKGKRRKGERRIIALVDVVKIPEKGQPFLIRVPVLVKAGRRARVRDVTFDDVLEIWDRRYSAGGRASYSKVVGVAGVFAV